MIVSPLLVKATILINNGKALDLGFGNGLEVLYLLSRNFKVTAIEKDNVLVNEIKLLNLNNLQIINNNILDFDFNEKFDLIN